MRDTRPLISFMSTPKAQTLDIYRSRTFSKTLTFQTRRITANAVILLPIKSQGQHACCLYIVCTMQHNAVAKVRKSSINNKKIQIFSQKRACVFWLTCKNLCLGFWKKHQRPPMSVWSAYSPFKMQGRYFYSYASIQLKISTSHLSLIPRSYILTWAMMRLSHARCKIAFIFSWRSIFDEVKNNAFQKLKNQLYY